MRYQDRPLFFYSPDEPAGGENTFADPGGWDAAEAAEVYNAGTAAAERTVADAVAKTDTKTADSAPAGTEAAAKPSQTESAVFTDPDKPADAEADKTDDESGKSQKKTDNKTPDKPEDKTEAKDGDKKDGEKPAISDERAALQAACDALGITETDPAEQIKAIAAVKAERETQQQKATEEREAQRLKSAEENWKKSAGDATTNRILDRMRTEGWDVDTDGCWDDATWKDTDNPAYAQELAARFNAEARTPEIEAFHRAQYEKAENGFKQTEQQYTEITTKYGHHDTGLISWMRDAGFPADQIESVARSTDEHTRRVIATTNTALTSATKELDTLRKSVAGHADAIAQAREDGRTEGLKEAAAEIAAGRSLGNTTGLGSTSPTSLDIADIFTDPGMFTMEDARTAYARS